MKSAENNKELKQFFARTSEPVLKQQLADRNLSFYRVPGDGNCFFHAVAKALNERKYRGRKNWDHVELRKLAVDYMGSKCNRRFSIETIPDNADLQRYITRMRLPDEFAEDQIIVAMGLALDLEIHVLVIPTKTNQITDFTAGVNLDNARALYVYYNLEDHYDALLPCKSKLNKK